MADLEQYGGFTGNPLNRRAANWPKCPEHGVELDRVKGRRGTSLWWCWKCEAHVRPEKSA